MFESFDLIDSKNDTHGKVQYIKGIQDVTGKYIWKGYKFLNVELVEFDIGSIRMKLISDIGLEINGIVFKNIHDCPITVLRKWRDNLFLTGDSDGLIKLWEYKKENNTIVLNQLSLLTCHLDKIVQIETFLENNILITLDNTGHVYSWDMTTHQVITCFSQDGKFITVSPQSGCVGIITTQDDILELFTFNGSKYTELKLARKGGNVTMLQSLEMIQPSKHQYLKDMDYFIASFSDSSISVFQLYLNGKDWKIKSIPILLQGIDTSHAVSSISCVRMILFQRDRQKPSNIQLILGYDNGTLETYSSSG